MSEFDGTTALRLLRTMCRIRAFEERVARLKRADEVHGLVHLSIGQEAVAAGVCDRLGAGNQIYSGHRAHGHAVASGVPLPGIMAELMGRTGGVCRGVGGSMHLVDTAHGLLGATGVVGGNIPIAAGTALAGSLTGSGAVTVVFFGDGAVQAGHFTESVNLAALWRLPLVLVCENNGYAEFTPRSAHTVVDRVSDVVAPYGVTCRTVDGNDAAAVWQDFGALAERARAGEGPALLECMTHRLRGHYEGDPQRYREATTKDDQQQNDPIRRLRDSGVTHGWFSAEHADDAERDAAQAVEQAVQQARESPEPDPDIAESLTYA